MDRPRRITRGSNKQLKESAAKEASKSVNTESSKNASLTAAVKSSLIDKKLAKQPRRSIGPSKLSAVSASKSNNALADYLDFEDDSAKSQTNFPITLTTSTTSLAPQKQSLTASVNSSYVAIPEIIQNVRDEEINSTIPPLYNHSSHNADNLIGRQRSMTPAMTNTETGSHYSRRSLSSSIFDGSIKDNYNDSEGEDDFWPEEYYNTLDDCLQAKMVNIERVGSAMCRQLNVPREFGGFFGILLLIILIPCLVLYLDWCSRLRVFSFKIPNWNFIQPTLIKNFFDLKIIASYVIFNMGIFILSILLPGIHLRMPGTHELKFTGLTNTVACLIAFVIAEFYQYTLADFIVKNYIRFVIYACLNAYVIAIWAYKRNSEEMVCINPYAKTGNFLIDYALGRQVNPKWLNFLEYKHIFHRISWLTTMLFAISMIRLSAQFPWLPSNKNYWQLAVYTWKYIRFDYMSLVTSSMLLIYVLDSLIFEHHLAFSFEFQNEGFGCLLLLRYATIPFLLSNIAKHFYEYRTACTDYNIIYIAWILLFIGLFIKRFSNALKYKYRLHPNHKSFLHVETIHTFQGRRLLVCSFWAFLRQPNYFGDIIALSALCLPLKLRFALSPLICIILIILVLLHRCGRVNERNSMRYQSSWTRYCRAVQYNIFPYLY